MSQYKIMAKKFAWFPYNSGIDETFMGNFL